MGMSAMYGPPKPELDMIKLVPHVVDSGLTFLDTSNVYGPHTNEILIGKALKGVLREKVQVASKFGATIKDGKLDICGDPAYVRAACEASLKRLDIDYIDLYYAHRVDTRVPIEVPMGEVKKLVKEGKIKYFGLSEASSSTIKTSGLCGQGIWKMKEFLHAENLVLEMSHTVQLAAVSFPQVQI